MTRLVLAAVLVVQAVTAVAFVVCLLHANKAPPQPFLDTWQHHAALVPGGQP